MTSGKNFLKHIAITMLLAFLLALSLSPMVIQKTTAQTTNYVTISGFAFIPPNLTIRPGDIVVWNNADPVVRTLWFVRVSDKSTYLLSDAIYPEATWSHTFNDVVDLQYYDLNRLWITGFLNVSAIAGPTSGLAYTDKQQYPIGAIVTLGFRNTGTTTITLSNTAPWSILDAFGITVFSPIAAFVLVDVLPGQSLTWTWDQKNQAGLQVAAGTYTFRIGTSAGYFTATFSIVAGKTQLTKDPYLQDMPSLLVVNTQVFQGYFLAYQSWQTGTANNGDLFIEKYNTNWNLLTRVQVTNLASYQDSPSLTLVNNGTDFLLELAYVSTETDGYPYIFVQTLNLNLGFIAKKQMTNFYEDLPSIIFDGSQSIYLAYQSWQAGDSYKGDVYLEKLNLNLVSLKKVRVTDETSYQDCPSLLYNPETGIVYVAYVSDQTGNYDIFLKQYDSSLNNYLGGFQLTTDSTDQYRPSLAPTYVSTVPSIQGFQMAYHSNETGPSNLRDIFVENFALSCNSLKKTQITNDQFRSATPSMVPSLVALGSSWCPGYVAYVSDEAGNWDIWLQQLASTPPTTYNIHLDSLEYTGASYSKGTIVFDGVSYSSLPIDISKAAGTYSVVYAPASGYQFDHLQTSGSISVSGSTAVVVSGAGTVTVVYKAIPPSTYSATIAAYCYTQGGNVAVVVSKDGSPSGSTPQTFTGLTGSHTFMVPNTDASGDAFKQWSTGSTSTTITVSSGGTYTAYYGAVQGPVVYVGPYLSVVKVGRNVAIVVNVANVTNLYSWQIRLYFNSSSVSCTGASYPDYHIFAGKPFTQVIPVIGQNYIGFGASLQGSGRFDGSGTLCFINFTSLKEGACPLQFDATDTFLLDSNLNSIATTTSPGLITVVPATPLIEDITGPNGVPDGIVNMYDISLVSKYFLQTVPPAPSICDITGQTPGVPDGKIDMKDISLVAKHFLEHYP